MKQVLIKTWLLLSVILTVVSCDKDEKEIGYDALPQKAQHQRRVQKRNDGRQARRKIGQKHARFALIRHAVTLLFSEFSVEF